MEGGDSWRKAWAGLQGRGGAVYSARSAVSSAVRPTAPLVMANLCSTQGPHIHWHAALLSHLLTALLNFPHISSSSPTDVTVPLLQRSLGHTPTACFIMPPAGCMPPDGHRQLQSGRLGLVPSTPHFTANHRSGNTANVRNSSSRPTKCISLPIEGSRVSKINTNAVQN
jgi:hypothetical protein